MPLRNGSRPNQGGRIRQIVDRPSVSDTRAPHGRPRNHEFRAPPLRSARWFRHTPQDQTWELEENGERVGWAEGVGSSARTVRTYAMVTELTRAPLPSVAMLIIALAAAFQCALTL